MFLIKETFTLLDTFVSGFFLKPKLVTYKLKMGQVHIMTDIKNIRYINHILQNAIFSTVFQSEILLLRFKVINVKNLFKKSET